MIYKNWRYIKHCFGLFYNKPWLDWHIKSLPEVDMTRSYTKGETIIEWSESNTMFSEFGHEEPRMIKLALVRANTNNEMYVLMRWQMERGAKVCWIV